MKLSITFLLLMISSIFSFAQNIDWEKAPVNPIPMGADLKLNNLKGDVLQESIINYFTRDGKWFSYEETEEVTKDKQGRVIRFKDYQGSTYNYKYDEKGNLIENKYNEAPPVVYAYDTQNRIIKESYKDNKNRSRTRDYSYEQRGDLLIVTEIKVDFGGERNERETHYRNGIEVYEKFKGYPGTRYEYQYDGKGNWISKSYIDTETNRTKLSNYDKKPIKPRTRDIIYYSDFDKGVSAMSIVLEDITKGRIANTPLISRPHINGKELKRQLLFCRLGNDYVLYVPMSKSYFISRNAYASTNKNGQILPFEKLISDAENILVAESKGFRIVENGKSAADANEWKTINYTNFLSCYVSVNQKNGRAYAFEDMPTLTDGRTVAVVGKLIPGTWYIPFANKNEAHIFENGVYVEGKYTLAGFLANTSSPVIQVGETTKKYYVLSDFDKAVDKKFFKARLFNSSTDKIDSEIKTNQSATTTTENKPSGKDVCVSGDCTNGFSKKQFANGETLEGFFVNGKANGAGTQLLMTGDYYIGNFKDDVYDGYGIYFWKNEDMFYYGMWYKGLQNGYGYQLKNSKAVVAGYFTNGKLTTDMLTYDYTNNIYKNSCTGNCSNGFGQYNYNDKSWYYGFFKDSKPHYLGIYKNNSGDVYMGEFNANKMEGTGTLIYKSSGTSYVGQFANSNFNGKGYTADKKFVVTQQGNWVNGKLTNTIVASEKPKPVNVNNKTLSNEATAYFEVYNSNQNGLKQHLSTLDKTWRAQKKEGDVLAQSYASLIEEIYNAEPQAAYEFMMKMEGNSLNGIITKLPTEIRAYIKQKSRETINKHTKTN